MWKAETKAQRQTESRESSHRSNPCSRVPSTRRAYDMTDTRGRILPSWKGGGQERDCGKGGGASLNLTIYFSGTPESERVILDLLRSKNRWIRRKPRLSLVKPC